MSRTTAVAGALALASLLASSCAVDQGANTGTRCADDGSCPPGTACYRGFCITGAGGECSEEGLRVDCYTGGEGTVGVGVCRPGQRICSEGTFGPCLGQVVPGLETCNGEDDDCNGRVDEFADASCDTGEPGACAEGQFTCRGMSAACQAAVDPTAETCNGLDDDCDGAVDDNTAVPCYPSGAAGCTERSDGSFECAGVCAPGNRACSDGELAECTGAVVPNDEPDGCTPAGTVAIDDDCDGMTDEDCDCTLDETQTCYGGPGGTAGTGVCTTGTQTCEDRGDGTFRFGACEGEVRPSAETCANEGTDDDCDGAVDDVPGRGDPCSDPGALGACRTGSLECTASGLECVTPEPAEEICNERDDDCDGTVDEGFDLLGDPANCGACGAACGAGLECCAGACVDTTSSPMHCGECGGSCGEGLACCGGECADTSTHADHCGSCGAACGPGNECCGGGCVDTRSSTDHCGSCGSGCAADQSCCGGTCAAPTSPTCTGCTEDCAAMGETCCSGSCADTQADPANCGACGNACDPGQLCCGGTCVDDDESNCGSCGTTCTVDQLCCGTGCVPDDEANCTACGESCAAGQTCCGTGCVDTSSDPMNCGGCGVTCGSGQDCTNGLCCNEGLTGCGGECVNTNTNDDHCGSCGRSCTVLGLGTCCAGACKLTC